MYPPCYGNTLIDVAAVVTGDAFDAVATPVPLPQHRLVVAEVMITLCIKRIIYYKVKLTQNI